MLEVGTYCGKSSVYLGAAARSLGRVLFTVDHHRGSEENQPGWEWHEPDLVDPAVGKMDTLPFFRKTIHDAGLEGTVIAVVGDSPTVATAWATPLAFLFIDGGHGEEPARSTTSAGRPTSSPAARSASTTSSPTPTDGGQAPHDHIYKPALESASSKKSGPSAACGCSAGPMGGVAVFGGEACRVGAWTGASPSGRTAGG